MSFLLLHPTQLYLIAHRRHVPNICCPTEPFLLFTCTSSSLLFCPVRFHLLVHQSLFSLLLLSARLCQNSFKCPSSKYFLPYTAVLTVTSDLPSLLFYPLQYHVPVHHSIVLPSSFLPCPALSVPPDDFRVPSLLFCPIRSCLRTSARPFCRANPHLAASRRVTLSSCPHYPVPFNCPSVSRPLLLSILPDLICMPTSALIFLLFCSGQPYPGTYFFLQQRLTI